MKKLLKYILTTLVAVAVIIGASGLWLRYEFKRVQYDSSQLSNWDQVTVRTLDDANTPQARCTQQFPHKKAWFGDLHVHTAASYDATSFGITTSVDEAYSFARGTPLPLRLRGDPPDYEPPVLHISSPLDFMAVTDHAESLGETRLCYIDGTPPMTAWSAACTAVTCVYRLKTSCNRWFDWRVSPSSDRIAPRASAVRMAHCAGTTPITVWRENQRSTESLAGL